MNNRKFNLTCSLILLNFGLLLGGLITSDQWMTLCMAVLGMYIAGNVFQKNISLNKYTDEEPKI